MSREEALCKVNDVFKEIFNDDSLIISEKTTSSDIEDWDSLEHINLMVAVEKKLNMKFKMGEVTMMKNVGEMLDIIQERTADNLYN